MPQTSKRYGRGNDWTSHCFDALPRAFSFSGEPVVIRTTFLSYEAVLAPHCNYLQGREWYPVHNWLKVWRSCLRSSSLQYLLVWRGQVVVLITNLIIRKQQILKNVYFQGWILFFIKAGHRSFIIPQAIEVIFPTKDESTHRNECCYSQSSWCTWCKLVAQLVAPPESSCLYYLTRCIQYLVTCLIPDGKVRIREMSWLNAETPCNTLDGAVLLRLCWQKRLVDWYVWWCIFKLRYGGGIHCRVIFSRRGSSSIGRMARRICR